MARSKKDATPAETGGDNASNKPPQGDTTQPTKPVQPASPSTTNIDFGTGLPTQDAPPAATGEQQPTQARTGQQPPNQSATTPTAGGEQQAFSQADIDRIVADRLDRERRKFSDYDDLKAASDELASLKGQQAEDDKLLAEKLADLQSRQDATALELQQERLRNTVLSAAAKMGFSDPSDAYLLVNIDNLDVGESGEVTGVTEALTKLKDDKPYLFQRGTVPHVEPANAARGDQTGRTDADRRREYFGAGGSSVWEGGGLIVVDRE